MGGVTFQAEGTVSAKPPRQEKGLSVSDPGFPANLAPEEMRLNSEGERKEVLCPPVH